MDVEAASFEQAAAALRRHARVLDVRASQLRAQVAGASWRTREVVLAQITDLATRAAQDRADAAAQEQSAALLRAEAGVLRVRARGNGGWRGAQAVNL
jgi:hypothetical protein